MKEIPQYLYGVPPMYGVKQQSVEFPQGFSVVLPIDFDSCGFHDFENYKLSAFIKDDITCPTVVWYGDEDNQGIIKKNDKYYIKIKLAESEQLQPGTYYLAVNAQRKIDVETLALKKTLVFEQTLSVRATAGAGCPINDVINTPVSTSTDGQQGLDITYLPN